MITTLNIQGMHCQACVRRLTAALGAAPGVEAVRVTLDPPRAEIESATPVSHAALDAAARGAGDYSISAADAPMSHATAAPAPAGVSPAPETPRASLYPLFLIVAYIAGAAALTTCFRHGAASSIGAQDAAAAAKSAAPALHTFMLDFMAGFFLVFSFFKLLDLRGFADAYRSYDLIAARSRPWALAYPFIELALGIAYLTRWQIAWMNALTLLLMLIGSAGVLRALRRKDQIRCACLGTALNLPMTTVTLIEDLAMAAMAAAGLMWTH